MSPATRAELELQKLSPDRSWRNDDLPIPTMRRMSLDSLKDSHNVIPVLKNDCVNPFDNPRIAPRNAKRTALIMPDSIDAIEHSLCANGHRNVCCQTDAIQEVVHIETTKHTISKFRWLMFFLSIPSCIGTLLVAFILATIYLQVVEDSSEYAYKLVDNQMYF